MLKKKVFIVGSSGHAKVVIDLFEKQGTYDILGLIDAFRQKGEDTCGYKVVGKEEDLPNLLLENAGTEVFVAIGDNWVRHKVVQKIKNLIPEIHFSSAIHPSATIGKNVFLGQGVAVMAGAVLNTDASVGDFCIVNTLASVDHDSMLKPFASLAPSVRIGGNVFIGEFTAISIGATIIHGIKIGNHSVIGAGAVVVKDLGDKLVAYGVPAKMMRNREIGEQYL